MLIDLDKFMQHYLSSNKVNTRSAASKKLIAILACACLVITQNAFAARMGGGKSYGMQRSISNKPQQQNYQQQPYQQQPAQQARPGMGAGTAGMLGAAAGAAGGYMLGRSMSNNNGNNINASGVSVQAEPSQSNIPWGTIGILSILLLLGLMMFRKNKANPGFSGNTNVNPNQPSSSNMFRIPGINRDNNTQNAIPGYYNTQQPVSTNPANGPSTMDKMPDGVETMYFLRQVKGTFLHIQSMNNPDNVSEVEKYMTSNLYQEIRSTISANSFVADFTNLDCQLIDCEANQGQLIASVKFFGMVSDEPNQPAHPFSEIWNFVKPDIQVNKWLVAGIQQETLA